MGSLRFILKLKHSSQVARLSVVSLNHQRAVLTPLMLCLTRRLRVQSLRCLQQRRCQAQPQDDQPATLWQVVPPGIGKGICCTGFIFECHLSGYIRNQTSWKFEYLVPAFRKAVISCLWNPRIAESVLITRFPVSSVHGYRISSIRYPVCIVIE